MSMLRLPESRGELELGLRAHYAQEAFLVEEVLEAPEELPFSHPNHKPLALGIKRACDIVGALIVAVLTLPIWLPIFLLIPLDSRGPALFRQERVGARAVREGNRVRWRRTRFTIYKFRTMFADADQGLHRTAVELFSAGIDPQIGDAAAPFKLTSDPRVTRLGRWLRRASLDELPQLINVMRGEMSLVGPRPLPPYEIALYQPWHCERLCAKPGITGLWQIEGRGRATFDEATALDISYVRAWSLALDLLIILKTVPAVITAKGAR